MTALLGMVSRASSITLSLVFRRDPAREVKVVPMLLVGV